MKLLLAAALLLFTAIARADTITANYGFIIPTLNSLGWAPKVDDWAVKLDTGAAWLTLPDTFQSSVTLNAPLLLNSGASLKVNSAAAWFQDFSSSGAVSIVSTDTYAHTNWPLTIGNLPATDAVGIFLRSTDTTVPQIYGSIKQNTQTSPIYFPTGITIPSGASAGFSNLYSLTQTQQLQVNDGGAATAVQVEGGVQAGCGAGFTGCVGIVGADGRIPAISTTYFANMNGSALTGIPSTGSIVGVYLPLSAGTGAPITGPLYMHQSSPYLEMQDTSDTDGSYLGLIEFANPTTSRHEIISTGQNASGILGMEGMLIIGAAPTVDTAGGNRGVVLAGHETLQPDLFVSTYAWVAVGSTNPVTNGTSGLWVGGNIVSTGNVTGASVTSQGTLAAVGVLEGFSGGFVQGGSFGIGTQSPAATLEVNGAAQIDGFITTTNSTASGYNTINIDNTSSTGFADLQLNIGASAAQGTAGVYYRPGTTFTVGLVANDTTTPIQFVTNNDSAKMTILPNGNTGIGTTSPDAQLTVGTPGTTGGYAGAEDVMLPSDQIYGFTVARSGVANQQGVAIGAFQTGLYSSIQAFETAVSYTSLDLNPLGGKVGVGLTSPATMLDVAGPVRSSSTFAGVSQFAGNAAFSASVPSQSTGVFTLGTVPNGAYLLLIQASSSGGPNLYNCVAWAGYSNSAAILAQYGNWVTATSPNNFIVTMHSNSGGVDALWIYNNTTSAASFHITETSIGL